MRHCFPLTVYPASLSARCGDRLLDGPGWSRRDRPAGAVNLERETF
jgi:hypothetical protein